ncbi:DUF3164 family protein [Epilithonimonas mollis]|uniref:DUF3164 family protein n=1 Tax=Epilithonimonas mollis TaxID=216903 RepID=A0A1M6UJ91_9FLAO|nr:DUF3164 family protein [Epilithonimonas mollis]SHK69282.1 Protein of unknown function [Epilithonimonas mollis]
MTTIDINALSPEQIQNLLKQASPEVLKASLSEKENETAENRKAYKQSVNEAVPVVINTLKTISLALQNGKVDVFQTLKILLDLKADAYDVKQGQQSHTFSDENGNSVVFGFRVNDGWDDTVNAGVDKIKEVISSLSHDENSAKLVSAIDKLLKKDAKGNLKASRVLELRQLAKDFNDTKFTDAVEIISAAYKPVRSAFFIEGYTTDPQGKKQSIPLSITSVDFPAGTDISELFPIEPVEVVESEKSEA